LIILQLVSNCSHFELILSGRHLIFGVFHFVVELNILNNFELFWSMESENFLILLQGCLFLFVGILYWSEGLLGVSLKLS
jgi:hypothetical protein